MESNYGNIFSLLRHLYSEWKTNPTVNLLWPRVRFWVLLFAAMQAVLAACMVGATLIGQGSMSVGKVAAYFVAMAAAGLIPFVLLHAVPLLFARLAYRKVWGDDSALRALPLTPRQRVDGPFAALAAGLLLYVVLTTSFGAPVAGFIRYLGNPMLDQPAASPLVSLMWTATSVVTTLLGAVFTMLLFLTIYLRGMLIFYRRPPSLTKGWMQLIGYVLLFWFMVIGVSMCFSAPIIFGMLYSNWPPQPGVPAPTWTEFAFAAVGIVVYVIIPFLVTLSFRKRWLGDLEDLENNVFIPEGAELAEPAPYWVDPGAGT